MEDIPQKPCIIFTVMLKIKMYQYNLKLGRIDTFFLGYSNLKYLIDINRTIAIGVAGGNRVLKLN